MAAELIIHMVIGWVKVWFVQASFEHHFSGKQFLWEDTRDWCLWEGTRGWLSWTLSSMDLFTGICLLCFLDLLMWLVSSKLQVIKLQMVLGISPLPSASVPGSYPWKHVTVLSVIITLSPLQNATQTFHVSRSYTPVTDQQCQSGPQHPFSSLKQAPQKEDLDAVSVIWSC